MSDARPFQAEIASPSVATALPAVAVMMAAAVAAAGCAAAGSIFAAAVTALLGLGCAASLTVALRRLAVRDSQVSLYEGWINQITSFAVMRLDMRGTIIAANEGGSSIHGYATADLLGRNVSCFYPKTEQGHEQSQDALRLAAANGTYEDRGWRIREDGTRFWSSVTLTSLRTEGAVVGFLKVFRDETARRQIEEKLWDSLTLLDSVVNGTNEVMYLKNAELRYELVNSAAALQFAKPRSELIGLDDFELYPREVALRLRKNDTKTMDSGAPQLVEEEIEVRGLRRIILAQLNPWRDHEGKIIGVVGVHTDITALRQAERDVRGLREYERLYNEAPVAYHEIDRTGTITRVNQAECALLGRSESELIGKPVWSFLVPEQRAASAEAIERKLRDEANPAPCQRTFLTKNGAPVAVWVHDSKILDENGGAIGLRSILVAAA